MYGKTIRLLSRYKERPHEFVREILGAEPDEWQAGILNELSVKPRAAVRSGHGVGKTALESWAILWFLFTRPECKIPCTAPTSRQLYDILWSELSKWLRRSELLESLFEWQKTKIICRAAPERWYAVARTAAKPENMAGFHEEHLLFVLDEASGISDEIFEAIGGALTTSDAKLLMCGNPTRNAGFFYRAFHEERDLYCVRKVSSRESGRVSSEYCERLGRQYGYESDVYRVRVEGEFPKGESEGLIELTWVESAMMSDKKVSGEAVIGVDVARYGTDETVLQPRIGAAGLESESYRHADLMTTTGRIIEMAERLRREYKVGLIRVNVDDDGLGGGVTDRLREVNNERGLNLTVQPCHNGGKSPDEHYGNRATYDWFHLRELLREGQISLKEDGELAGQLSTRRYGVNSSGQVVLEKKSEYKRRTGRSPDRADALVLAFRPERRNIIMPAYVGGRSYWR